MKESDWQKKHTIDFLIHAVFERREKYKLENFLSQMIMENKAHSTIDTYYARLKVFHEFLKATGNDPKTLTPATMILFKNDLLNKGLSDRYINNILSVVKNYFDYLILNGERTDFNPVLPPLKLKAKYPETKILTPDQQQQFLSWASNLQKNLYVGFLLMLFAGCRVSEACNLKLSDISLHKDGALYLNIEGAKWGSDREVPVMCSHAAKIIYEHMRDLEVSSLPVTRCSSRTLQTYATQFSNETGIPMSCHTLRHTFATRLLEKGVEIEQIRRLMGHKNINMTAHYTQQANISFKAIAPTIWQAETQ